MALTLTNTTLSDPADKSEVEANFTDIANKFNGGVVNADLSSSAGITNGKLADKYEHICVRLHWRASVVTGTSADGAWDGFSDNELIDAVAIPGDSSDTAWEVTDITWFCSDCGDGTSKFNLDWGDYDEAGSFQSNTSLLDDQTLVQAGGSAADVPNEEHPTNGASTSLAFTDQPRSLILRAGSVIHANTMSAVGAFLTVSVFLRRPISSS
jgi:hypothetical protein